MSLRPSKKTLITLGILLPIGMILIWPVSVWVEWKREQRIIEQLGGFESFDVKAGYIPIFKPFLYRHDLPMDINKYFERYVEVNLIDKHISNETLRILGKLKYLDSLALGSGFNDKGLQNYFTSPNSLHMFAVVSNHTISAHGLENIANLSDLYLIEIIDTPIGDEGCRHVSNLSTNIEWVSLNNTMMSDKGLLYFASSPPHELRIDESGITRKGLDEFLDSAHEETILFVSQRMISNLVLRTHTPDTQFSLSKIGGEYEAIFKHNP